MNQEKELLEKVKEQYKKKAAISILRERDWEIISQRYANELLKLRLEKIIGLLKTVRVHDRYVSDFNRGYNSAFNQAEEIIDETLKEL